MRRRQAISQSRAKSGNSIIISTKIAPMLHMSTALV